ncbi:hypothetical protein PO148_08575 [Limosilactobacillus mucosae]|uniref:Uncharacterized protein n=1 Tax=Limosilactobacillus mucosae TaxID=97478 RepID=A0AAJ1HU03_LIMMU|nr:hypothetical protein [Limosilactobacillus mucosae]MDC2830734.1 hypothetical protein [Limosilactobacillus mucosae]MDC2837649.1 hypothetical protein [Limosilactobacillus mucosae]MDC2850030.1 hypothetical protein [Limosilactobacillus mucosae]
MKRLNGPKSSVGKLTGAYAPGDRQLRGAQILNQQPLSPDQLSNDELLQVSLETRVNLGRKQILDLY